MMGTDGNTGGGYTEMEIRISNLWTDVVRPDGSTYEVDLGKVVGDAW